MEPELQPSLPLPDKSAATVTSEPGPAVETSLTSDPSPKQRQHGVLRWIFIGNQGLRCGWSVLLFILFTVIFLVATSALIHAITGRGRPNPNNLSPFTLLIGEAMSVLAILVAATLMALIERRHILDYNLRGPHRAKCFLTGLAGGFVALSVLVGALAWGGWLRFGPVALSGSQILGFGVVWGLVFLLTGFFEEGSFRCYLLYTFARGINFWWAVGLVGAMCLDLVLTAKGNGVWGVYLIALLLLVPCLVLYLKRASDAGFWYAAWVTSALFGFVHTSNGGENWIGIFSAAAVGFGFCVSVWLTGSAWWAIGFHAAWDWSETFFYGTANSGLIPKGHFLTTTPTGNPLWSGGTDGPEGSLLVIGVLLVVFLYLLLVYGRGKLRAPESAA
jgi:uncharacterized protein